MCCVCACACMHVCVCACVGLGQTYIAIITVKLITATMSNPISTPSIHANSELERVGPTVGSGRALIVTAREGSNACRLTYVRQAYM